MDNLLKGNYETEKKVFLRNGLTIVRTAEEANQRVQRGIWEPDPRPNLK